MESCIRKKSVEFLQSLIGKPLLYAKKSPDTQLYDFGFGELIQHTDKYGNRRIVGKYALHILCRFKVIYKNSNHPIQKYYEDTPHEKFQTDVQQLIGRSIVRIALSDKNDLWLDFDEYWIVFATFENCEESWRFFSLNKKSPHLVASNIGLEFQ